MLYAMPWPQFEEWQDYFALEPFGEERDDLRAGQIAAMVANVHKGKGGRTLKASDFLLTPERGKGRGGRGRDTSERQPMTDPKDHQRLLRILRGYAVTNP